MAYGHQLKTTEILDICPIGFRQGLTQLCNKCVASTKCVIVICDEDDFHGLYLGVSHKKECAISVYPRQRYHFHP